MPPAVRVGVGVFVLHSTTTTQNPSFLIGKRLNSHGAATWGLPGGNLEYGEEWATCGARETQEETGLVLREARMEFWGVTNDFMGGEGRHYVTVFMVGERADAEQEARNMEEDKCEGWEWMSWEDLVGHVDAEDGGEGREKGVSRRIFAPLANLVRQVKGSGAVPALRNR